jgi:DNA methylase
MTGGVRLLLGDCLDLLPTLAAGSVDAVVTDPPYALGFMGKKWDTPGSFVERKPEKRNCFDHVGGNHNPSNGFDQARTRRAEAKKFQKWCEQWATAALRVLKPGGYLLAFGGTRTYHRLACAVEDAGFEVRDCLMWLYGTGFPKGKGCLKPSWEPILLARKPGPRVLPLQIDGCRIPTGDDLGGGAEKRVAVEGKHEGWKRPWMERPEDVEAHAARVRENVAKAEALGRWPANLCLSHLPECNGACADGCPARLLDEQSGERPGFGGKRRGTKVLGGMNDDGWQPRDMPRNGYEDTGGASRFFYCSKASRKERDAGLENYQPVRLRADLTPEKRAWVLEELRKAGVSS